MRTNKLKLNIWGPCSVWLKGPRTCEIFPNLCLSLRILSRSRRGSHRGSSCSYFIKTETKQVCYLLLNPKVTWVIHLQAILWYNKGSFEPVSQRIPGPNLVRQVLDFCNCYVIITSQHRRLHPFIFSNSWICPPKSLDWNTTNKKYYEISFCTNIS